MGEGSNLKEGATAELGRPTAPALLLSLGLSIGVGTALGLAYGTGNYWVGQFKVYSRRGLGAMALVNLAIFAGALWVLSRTTRRAATISHFRSFAFARLLGVAGGLACIYAAWAAFASWSAPVPGLRVLPSEVWARLTHSIREVGGPFISLIYATEAAALLFLPSLAARRSLDETPYCGACRRWLTIRRGIYRIGSSNLHRLLPLLRQGRLEALEQAVAPQTTDFVRLDFTSCDQCTSDGYLSLVRVKDHVDGRGKLHHWETPLLKGLQVRRDDLDRVTGRA